jgi:hypothetical protein
MTDEFSLLAGGPLFRLWRRSRLADDSLHLLHRRIVVLVVVAWLPLLVLSVIDGRAWSSAGLDFFHDAEIHLRLLVAMPLLVFAEQFVHVRMRPMVSHFLGRGLVADRDRGAFDEALASAARLRDSGVAEALLLVLVYTVGVWVVWSGHAVSDAGAWYGEVGTGTLKPTTAGWWLSLVSLPLFQFILLRWYYRLMVWARLLWQVSRLDLRYVPNHPDQCGGIGFLAASSYAFTPLLFAQGVLLSGLMANRILHAGARLPDFKLELIGLVGVMLLAILGPLLSFCPGLSATKRAAMEAYGQLFNRYSREFEAKWLHGRAPEGEALLGTADIQSLADLGNSYGLIRDMRWVPFSHRAVIRLAITTLLPASPLLLTVLPLEELLGRLLAVVF